MVKRVAGRDGRRVWVLGDCPAASTDSRTFGWVTLPPVIAQPAYRYAPSDRAGPLTATLRDDAGAPGGSPAGSGP